MDHPVLLIVMRFVHIASAILAVGGGAFTLLVLSGASGVLDPSFKKLLMTATQQRFAKVLWASIAGLVISGVYNWLLLAPTYKAMGPLGNALIGTKVLLAVVLFVLIYARSAGFVGADHPRRWLTVQFVLAMVIVAIAAALRYFRLEFLAAAAG